MLRKVLICTLFAIVATIGVGASGGSALASSCRNVTPLAPGIHRQPPTSIQATTLFTCDTSYEIQYDDTLFLGGEPWSWAAGTYDFFRNAGTNYDGVNFNCPIGGPHWWGHWMRYRIRWTNVPGTVFGPWHQTQASAGIYDRCA